MFENKEMISLERAPQDEETPAENLHEGPAGELLMATIDAANEHDAYAKAKELQIALQHGVGREETEMHEGTPNK
jgi:hypothetical protein